MKDYKRLTKRYGDIVSYAKPLQSDFIGAIYEEQKERDGEIINRLADLEDKIENGELCDREEIRKETAREILQELYNRLELVSEDGACTMMLCNTHLFDLAKQFNVNLEDEE